MKRFANWPAVLGGVVERVVNWAVVAFLSLLAIGVAAVVGMMLMVLSPWWETTRIDVSPAEANATIHQRFAIPATARNVSFNTTPWESMVTFRVDPDAFDAWARSGGLRVTAIEPGLPVMVFAIHCWGETELGHELLLDGGSGFDEPGECFVFGVYDRHRRRCYARFSRK